MIYLMKQSTSKIIGTFDTISLAKNFLSANGVTDFTPYLYLRSIDDMSYISRICDVDGVCIYNNKDFWLNQSHDVSNDFDNHTVVDAFGAVVDKTRFDIEMNNNTQRLNNVYSAADEVAYNIKVGFEFISIFRQTCILSDLGEQSGLGIATATADVIPLVMTGAFAEAATVLSVMPRDAYLTDEKLMNYAQMITVADVITYT